MLTEVCMTSLAEIGCVRLWSLQTGHNTPWSVDYILLTFEGTWKKEQLCQTCKFLFGDHQNIPTTLQEIPTTHMLQNIPTTHMLQNISTTQILRDIPATHMLRQEIHTTHMLQNISTTHMLREIPTTRIVDRLSLGPDYFQKTFPPVFWYFLVSISSGGYIYISHCLIILVVAFITFYWHLSLVDSIVRVPEDCRGHSYWICYHGFHWVLCQADPHSH